MLTTTNLILNKPELTDVPNIEAMNPNWDTIDTEITSLKKGKVDSILEKGLSTNDYTDLDKKKLDGIAENANNYVHPTTHPASVITGLSAVATTGNYTDLTGMPSEFTPKSHTHDVASMSSNGYLSASDKTKLDGIEINANKYTHPTGDGNLHIPITGTLNRGKVLIAGETAGSVSWGSLPTSLPANGGDATTVKGRDICTEVDDLKLYVSNGKQKVATAITGKGIASTGSDSFETLANNITKIESISVSLDTIQDNMVNLLYYTLHYSFDSYWCDIGIATELLDGALQSGQVKSYLYSENSENIYLKGSQFIFVLGSGNVTHDATLLDECGAYGYRGYLLGNDNYEDSYNVSIHSNGGSGRYFLLSL